MASRKRFELLFLGLNSSVLGLLDERDYTILINKKGLRDKFT